MFLRPWSLILGKTVGPGALIGDLLRQGSSTGTFMVSGCAEELHDLDSSLRFSEKLDWCVWGQIYSKYAVNLVWSSQRKKKSSVFCLRATILELQVYVDATRMLNECWKLQIHSITEWPWALNTYHRGTNFAPFRSTTSFSCFQDTGLAKISNELNGLRMTFKLKT